MIQEYAAETEHAVNRTNVIHVSMDGLDFCVTYQNALGPGQTAKTHPALGMEHVIYLIHATVSMAGLGKNVIYQCVSIRTKQIRQCAVPMESVPRQILVIAQAGGRDKNVKFHYVLILLRL